MKEFTKRERRETGAIHTSQFVWISEQTRGQCVPAEGLSVAQRVRGVAWGAGTSVKGDLRLAFPSVPREGDGSWLVVVLFTQLFEQGSDATRFVTSF